MKTIIGLLFALASQMPAPVHAAVPKIAYQVICDDPTANELISGSVRSRMTAAGLEFADRLPFKKLVVYAQRDVNDTINANGWTFAIAHVSNQATYFVASRLLPTHGPEIDEAKPVLIDMIKEDGFLTYLNTAHLDRLDAGTASILADLLVTELVKRLPK